MERPQENVPEAPFTRTVERALGLLAVVCEVGALPLAEAARRAGLSSSTALRLLRTLESTGFVHRDAGGEFRPGARTIQVGAQALGRESVLALSRSALEATAAATGESTYLSMRGHGDTCVYVDMVEGTRSVRHASWVGRSIPLRGSAAGRALLDDLTDDGFAVAPNGVEEDVTAVAAPVRTTGRTLAALSVVAPSYRMPPELARTTGLALVRSADRISAALGGEPAGRPTDPSGSQP